MGVIAQIGQWFDQRLQLAAPVREAAEHPVPRNTASWFYVFGSAALTVFLLQLVTGIMLGTSRCGPRSCNSWRVWNCLFCRRSRPWRCLSLLQRTLCFSNDYRFCTAVAFCFHPLSSLVACFPRLGQEMKLEGNAKNNAD